MPRKGDAPLGLLSAVHGMASAKAINWTTHSNDKFTGKHTTRIKLENRRVSAKHKQDGGKNAHYLE